MKVKLPKLMENYIDASNKGDLKAYLGCFTANASVTDDGEELTGHGPIGKWFAETSEKYNSTSEPLGIKESADQIIMTLKTSGTFDGSPLTFEHHFDLRSGLIQELRIVFLG